MGESILHHLIPLLTQYPLGYSFAAGTTDWPGPADFTQGTISTNPFWEIVKVSHWSQAFRANESTDETLRVLLHRYQLISRKRVTLQNLFS
jgi:hypothetical protein